MTLESPQVTPAVEAWRVLDAIQDPILVIDRSLHIAYMNVAARDRFGVHDLMGTHTCFMTTHGSTMPCEGPGMACPVRTVYETGAPAHAIHFHRTVKGALLPEEVMASPIRGEDGSVAYVVEQLRDAMELLESKEIIEHMRNELDLLRGLLPICASCKRIRTQDSQWEEIERYIGTHSSAKFSHGICPECAVRLYPDYFIRHKKT